MRRPGGLGGWVLVAFGVVGCGGEVVHSGTSATHGESAGTHGGPATGATAGSGGFVASPGAGGSPPASGGNPDTGAGGAPGGGSAVAMGTGGNGTAGKGGANNSGNGGASNSGNGGAGASGAGGGPSAGGTAGGAAGGAVSWSACTVAGTCVVRPDECCPCDGGASDAVYWGAVALHDAGVCPSVPKPSCAGACLPKPALVAQHFLGVCEAGTCALTDVRTSPLSACTHDAECVLHTAGCCPACVPDPNGVVALAGGQVAAYEAQACNPESPVSCACAPTLPIGATAICNPNGHCAAKLAPGACPKEMPQEGAPCVVPAVFSCDYGTNFLLACRPTFTCASGAWKATPTPPSCATAPMTGCKDGSPCTPAGAWCATGTGASCTCEKAAWICAPPPNQGCPPAPPENGQPCATQALSCTYGSCQGADGVRRDCVDGVWVDRWQYCLP